MFCNHCGAENPAGSAFCAKCGQQLGRPANPDRALIRIVDSSRNELAHSSVAGSNVVKDDAF